MDEDELRKFVNGVLDGKIFTSEQVKDRALLPMVFMVLALSDKPLPKGTAVVWEWYDQCLPRSINGYPIFSSMRCMSLETWRRARAAIVAEQERRKSIPV